MKTTAYGLEDVPRIGPNERNPLAVKQGLAFGDWLAQVEEHVGHIVPSLRAARMYNEGVAVMDAVVRLTA